MIHVCEWSDLIVNILSPLDFSGDLRFVDDLSVVSGTTTWPCRAFLSIFWRVRGDFLPTRLPTIWRLSA